MFLKIRKYIKLLAGFLTLWSLFSIFTIFHKNVGKVNGNTDTDKKDPSISSAQQDTDNNSFLFVDCTGFFE